MTTCSVTILNPLGLHAQAAPVATGKSDKACILIFNLGAPSQLDCWDPKPDAPAEIRGPFRPIRTVVPGMDFCELFPHLGSVADDLCIIRSMVTEAINHDPAHTFMNTGTLISGRPSMGSWVWYGLGCDTQDLPGFVVLTSTGKSGQMQPIASRQWHSGFLPSRFQGVHFRSKGDAVLYLRDPDGVTRGQQRDVIDAVEALTRSQPDWVDDPEVAARLTQYEMAFRMQTAVPRLTDFSDEPRHVLDAYGVEGMDGSFGANCLLAR